MLSALKVLLYEPHFINNLKHWSTQAPNYLPCDDLIIVPLRPCIYSLKELNLDV